MTRTVGIEEEYLLVQGTSPFLAAVGEQVVAVAIENGEGQFEHELKQEQAEIGTAPHRDIRALAEELRARRTALARAADSLGVRLLASGTSPLDEQTSTTIDRRYERMSDVYGRLAKMQLTCGLHVHVAIGSQAEGVAVLDRIRGWLPVVAALSSNSPFFAGQETEYASYRSVLWGQWPTAGATDPFGTVEAYEQARADLITAGAALDEGMIYFDARLSARYPTVEVRVCDVCADVADAPVLAALIRALVSTAATQAAAGAPVPPIRGELMRAAKWRAARFGIEGELVDPIERRLLPAGEIIDGMLEAVAPALRETGDEAFVRDGLERIRDQGTGARLQREAYAAHGITGVVDAIAERTVG